MAGTMQLQPWSGGAPSGDTSAPAGPGKADQSLITDPTGGAPNFSVLDAFKSFGYYPTQAEIDALAPSFEGRIDPGTIGRNAVAQYVNYQNQIAQFKANDPLVSLQKEMGEAIDLQTKQVQGLYGQLQDTLTSAPKLFGSLTPDQINEYLKPLQTAFTSQLSQVQGAMASRGVAGSSTENNALAATDQQFKEQTLATGLSIGQQQQTARASSIQAQIAQLFGLVGTETGVKGAAAGQQSKQDLATSNLVGSLPSFLNAQSAEEEQIAKSNQGGGFWDTFNKVTSGINKATDTLENLAFIPQQFKSQAPGAPSGGGAGVPPGGNALFTSSATPGYHPTDTGMLSLFGS